MKRAGLMLLAVIGLAAMAHEALAQQEVTSVNVVGFKKVDLAGPGGFTQVGMQFDAFDPTVEGVLGTQLIATAKKVDAADQVFFWDPASVSYKRCAMKTDNKFYDCDNFAVQTNPPLRSSEGFWIRSTTNAPATRSIVLAGEAVPDGAITNTIVKGFQMLAFPFSCDVSLQDLDFANDGATASKKVGQTDHIYVYQNNAYSIYALNPADMKWHDFNNFNLPAVETNIPLGQGFWYEAQGVAGFPWSETNRYKIN